MSTTLERPRGGAPEAAGRQPSGALQRTGDWARRAPLLPALILTVIVTQLPFLVTIVISFMNWNAYYPDERGFAGLGNYLTVLTDVNMRDSIIVTIELTVVVVLVSLVLGMVIALLLDRKFRGRGVVRVDARWAWFVEAHHPGGDPVRGGVADLRPAPRPTGGR